MLGDGQRRAELPSLQPKPPAPEGHGRILRFRGGRREPRRAQAQILQPAAPLGQGRNRAASRGGRRAGCGGGGRTDRGLTPEGAAMDWERIAGNWKHYKQSVRQRWGRITEEELDLIGGRRAQLAAHIQELYGISKDAAQMQLESWQGIQTEP